MKNIIIKEMLERRESYAPLNIVPRLQWVWESVPKQLAKENNKFVFSQVKAAENARAKSFALFCKRYGIKKGFKLTLKNVAVNEQEGQQVINLPLYLVWRLSEY